MSHIAKTDLDEFKIEITGIFGQFSDAITSVMRDLATKRIKLGNNKTSFYYYHIKSTLYSRMYVSYCL